MLIERQKLSIASFTNCIVNILSLSQIMRLVRFRHKKYM